MRQRERKREKEREKDGWERELTDGEKERGVVTYREEKMEKISYRKSR